MTQADLDSLIEMGFERPRAELAIKKSGNLNNALQWLEDNQDKPLEDLDASADGDEPESAEAQEGAQSLVCNDCGKLFKNADLATYHASKTQHTDFSESTEAIKPLTEEEKKEKLEALRQKLKDKRANQSVQDKEEQKRNEEIRRKANKDSQETKEELQRKQALKDAASKRQEKKDDMDAKARIRAKIEADKLERQRKAQEAKAAREGNPLPPSEPAAPAAEAPRPKANHNEARLRLQTSGGNIQKTFPAETTLFEVAQAVEAEVGSQVTSLTMTFPRKVFEGSADFGKTLKEAGLVPSAVLIAKSG